MEKELNSVAPQSKIRRRERKATQKKRRLHTMKPLPEAEDLVDLQKLEQLASLGLSLAHLAWSFGISSNRFTVILRRRTDFVEAIQRGVAKRAAILQNRLLQLMDEGNVAAVIFGLKQMGYVERVYDPTRHLIDTQSEEAAEPAEGAVQSHGVLVVPAVDDSMEEWEKGASVRQAKLIEHGGRSQGVDRTAGQPSGLPPVPVS